MHNSREKAIILASFGTSYNSSRSITIGAIESTFAESFPGYDIRRAFTSGMIINKLKKRDGIVIDTVSEALSKLSEEGFKEVIIQPTTIIEGQEYDLICEAAEEFRGRFKSLLTGHSLLSCEADYERLINILDEITASEASEDTARVFMGHGTEHGANSVYAKLQETADELGIKNFFIGTVEAEPDVNDVLKAAKACGAKRAVLSPLMIVAGDHAVNDMAGDEEDSWKSIFEAAGFTTVCRVKGLGGEYQIQQMIADHCRKMEGK